jgi:YHS domain-containing protein
MKTNHLPVLALLALATCFAATPAPALAADTKSKIENQKSEMPKPYPLKVCLVTDSDLDSMGDEISFVYQGQEIKICCKPCEKKFLRSPEKYLAKLAALAAAKK